MHCGKVVNGPCYQPLGWPAVLRSCGTVAHQWRQSFRWGPSWLPLFLDQPHSCFSLTTSHYTVDESEKCLTILVEIDVHDFLSNCHTISLQEPGPTTVCIKHILLFSLASFGRQPFSFLQEKLRHSQQHTTHQCPFKRDNLTSTLYGIHQHNS